MEDKTSDPDLTDRGLRCDSEIVDCPRKGLDTVTQVIEAFLRYARVLEDRGAPIRKIGARVSFILWQPVCAPGTNSGHPLAGRAVLDRPSD